MPIFHFYAPMFYYAMGILKLLGFGFAQAVQWLYGLCFLAAALGSGYIMHRIFGFAAGIVTGIFFVYTPYFLAGPYIRGNGPELIALSLAVWCGALIVEFLYRPSFVKFIAGIALGALLTLAHNVTALMFYPVLLLLGLFYDGPGKMNYKNQAVSVLLILSLGPALSAFFWIPAIFERDQVQLHRLVEGPYQWEKSFLTPRQWIIQEFDAFALSKGKEVSKLPVQLGYSQAGVFVVFLLISLFIVAGRKNNRLLAAGIVLLVLVSLFLTLEQSSFLYEFIPFISLFQFPWRFCASAAFGAALAGGFFVHLLTKNSGAPVKFIAALVLSAAAIAGAKPYIQDHPFMNRTGVVSSALMNKNLTLDKLLYSGKTTTTANEYLPKGARPLKPSGKRFTVISGKIDMEYVKTETHSISMDIKAEPGSVLRFEVYGFPGWTVKINGRSFTPERDDYGRMIVEFNKKTEGKLLLYFGQTTLRIISGAASLVAFIILFAACLIYKKTAYTH